MADIWPSYAHCVFTRNCIRYADRINLWEDKEAEFGLNKNFMKNSQKGFAPVILLLLIGAVIIAGGVFAYMSWEKNKHTPNDAWLPVGKIADWKTYTNEKYGFEFKYPTDWSVASTIKGPTVSLWSPEHKNQMEVTDFRVNFCGTTSDCLKKLNQNNGTDAKTIKDFLVARYENYKEITVDGKKAFEWISTAADSSYTLYIESTNGIYVISAPEQETELKVSSTVKEIISTFKFTR